MIPKSVDVEREWLGTINDCPCDSENVLATICFGLLVASHHLELGQILILMRRMRRVRLRDLNLALLRVILIVAGV